MRVLKTIALALFLLASFGFGIVVGMYKVFPFQQILYVKQALLYNNAGDVLFSSAAGRNDVVEHVETKRIIDCPKVSQRVGVLISFGQSNSANSASYLVKEAEVPNVINYYKGNCYTASSPLLGATRARGEWISLTAQNIVNSGLYDEMIILSLGIGGSPVSAWAEGSELNKRLISSIKEIQENYPVTELIWHQGESDIKWNIGSEEYFRSFETIHQSLRDSGVTAPLFVSVASYCQGTNYPNHVTTAQQRLAKELPGVELGVNTDELISSEMRHDDCHFNEAGQRLAAKEMANIILTYHMNK